MTGARIGTVRIVAVILAVVVLGFAAAVSLSSSGGKTHATTTRELTATTTR